MEVRKHLLLGRSHGIGLQFIQHCVDMCAVQLAVFIDQAISGLFGVLRAGYGGFILCATMDRTVRGNGWIGFACVIPCPCRSIRYMWPDMDGGIVARLLRRCVRGGRGALPKGSQNAMPGGPIFFVLYFVPCLFILK